MSSSMVGWVVENAVRIAHAGGWPVAVFGMREYNIGDDDYSLAVSYARQTDGTDPAWAMFAMHKALTVKYWGVDTAHLVAYQSNPTYIRTCRSIYPFFCPWDGGIEVIDRESRFYIGVHGCATGLADRRLAVAAATDLGLKTRFNSD